MRVCFPFFLIVLGLAMLSMDWGGGRGGVAFAQDGSSFLGVPIDGQAGTYLATKTVNLRAKPDTKGEVVMKIAKGTHVEVAGGVENSSWLAVILGEGNAETRGFAYAPVFLPLIDGTLDDTLTVRVEVPDGPVCDADILFEGKTVVEEEMFAISDYEAIFQCVEDGKELVFTAYMFMTEAPFDLKQKPRYQINLDLREVGQEYDETFSSVFIYDHKGGTVTFDGLTLKGYGRTLKDKNRDAASPADAVAAAVAMAPLTWNAKVWKALRNGGEAPQ